MHKHQNIHAQSHKPYMHKHKLLILAKMVDKSLQSIPRSTSILTLRVVNSPDHYHVGVTVCACVRVRAFVCTRLCGFFYSSVLCFCFGLCVQITVKQETVVWVSSTRLAQTCWLRQNLHGSHFLFHCNPDTLSQLSFFLFLFFSSCVKCAESQYAEYNESSNYINHKVPQCILSARVG